MIPLNKDTGGSKTHCGRLRVATAGGQCANKFTKLVDHFAPLQLGIGIPGGCEAAVHATRRFDGALCPGQVLVKLDFTNAFNTLRWDAMLEVVYAAIPEIYPFALQSYSAPSSLRFGHLYLSSQVGPQQGDPLGPLLFSLPL